MYFTMENIIKHYRLLSIHRNRRNESYKYLNISDAYNTLDNITICKKWNWIRHNA